ncbi:MAG: hypothetical protein AAF467_21280 [Actinomycetota bacterium]
MASQTKSSSARGSGSWATVQWVAIAILGVLAVVASFVFLGNGSAGGRGTHGGLAPIAAEAE